MLYNPIKKYTAMIFIFISKVQLRRSPPWSTHFTNSLFEALLSRTFGLDMHLLQAQYRLHITLIATPNLLF